MTCKEAIGVLADYLEQSLTPEMAEALEGHLKNCRPCVAYLNTYKRTRELARRAGSAEMPPEMRRRLRSFLLRQLGTDRS
ncbi:MAG TPA: zf-HC2 domain-containing protein [Methylomirabilota bacterium]|nr:zf-HC2 domain-containing protein [Methylomirabilota bacterium]